MGVNPETKSDHIQTSPTIAVRPQSSLRYFARPSGESLKQSAFSKDFLLSGAFQISDELIEAGVVSQGL
jgi:hypothetical protein